MVLFGVVSNSVESVLQHWKVYKFPHFIQFLRRAHKKPSPAALENSELYVCICMQLDLFFQCMCCHVVVHYRYSKKLQSHQTS